MRKKYMIAGALTTFAATTTLSAQDKNKMTHEMTEFYSPEPPVVTPGTEIKGGGFTAPSDAIVLFDGKDLSKWENTKGGPAEWKVKDGVITVDKSKGDIQTKDKFNDFQLHIEWRVPKNIEGSDQLRGNSGIYLQGMYEVQVLDNYNNKTYVNGMAGSIYKQTAPLANAMRKPGEWNVNLHRPHVQSRRHLSHTSARYGNPERRDSAKQHRNSRHDRVHRIAQNR